MSASWGGFNRPKQHSSLWGGDALDRVRAGDSATLYGRRLVAYLMVQPIAARQLLADPIARGQGFLTRFLITEPPNAIGTRLGQAEGSVAGVGSAAASAHLSEVLNQPLPTKENSPQELEPRFMSLSAEAKKLLVGFYQAIEKEQALGGSFEQLKSFASKSSEQAASKASD